MLKLRELLKQLPGYMSGFFLSLENATLPLTRLNYAYDLRLFFSYLKNEPTSPLWGSVEDVKEITIEMLAQLKLRDFREYLSYLDIYFNGEGERTNSEKGRKRKLCSLRRFFKYLYNEELIKENIVSKIETPKILEKPIIHLDENEILKIIEVAATGEGITDKQRQYHAKTKFRDTAIIVLFLTTGIRISELVGLNIGDINFNDKSMLITRKGGNSTILYFGDTTQEILREYLDLRGDHVPSNPLFLSLQGKRIGVQAVQNLVKKYAGQATPLKKISPHKLRSTYGTKLYRDTGDIYLVAEVLGHADVNTTKRHYAAMSEENKKYAAQAYKLNISFTKEK